MVDRTFRAMSTLVILLFSSLGFAQEEKKTIESPAWAIKWLSNSLDKARQIDEYSGMLVRRERIKGELRDTEFWKIKIQNNPKQIYGRNLKPVEKRGTELLYREGKRDGKMLALPGRRGGCGQMLAKLDPSGSLWMRNERHPFTEWDICSVANRFLKLLETTKDLEGCTIRFLTSCKINKRSCSKLEVGYTGKNKKLRFHKIDIYVDNEYKIPVRFAAYELSKSDGDEKPILIEEYTFVILNLSPAFTEKDSMKRLSSTGKLI